LALCFYVCRVPACRVGVLRKIGANKKGGNHPTSTRATTAATGGGAAPRRFILRTKTMISPDTALLSFEPHSDDGTIYSTTTYNTLAMLIALMI
jgi:hypothetical protein